MLSNDVFDSTFEASALARLGGIQEVLHRVMDSIPQCLRLSLEGIVIEILVGQADLPANVETSEYTFDLEEDPE